MIDGNPIWQRLLMWAMRWPSPSRACFDPNGGFYTLRLVFARPWRWRKMLRL